MKTPLAITSLIKRYGVTIKHYKRPLPDTASPWKTQAQSPQTAVEMTGLIQHLRADHQDGLPEGGIKAVVIMMIDADRDIPKPGDDLVINGQRWRASTILPQSSTRSTRLLEVLVTSRGEAVHE